MASILSTSCISAGYQREKVLHDVSLQLNAGERVLLVGPNGCGKSTLLRVLGGALRPWSGTITYQGEDVTNILGNRRARLGFSYLMQTKNIFPSLSVEENLHLSAWLSDGGYASRREWVLSIFPLLRDKLQNRAGALSGGLRQALAISMVLMKPAGILLLDEPTAGLAPTAASTILSSLHEAQERACFTSIMVEHNIRTAAQWVTRVDVLNQGRIVASGLAPESLIEQDLLQKYYFV